MGNVPRSRPVSHVLELILSPPCVDLPPGKDGRPVGVFARVGTLEDRSQACNVNWEQPIIVRLDNDQSVLFITLLSWDSPQAGGSEVSLLTEVFLPYSGPNSLVEMGLRRDGPPVPLRLELTAGSRHDGAIAEDRGYLALSLRQLPRDVVEEPASVPGTDSVTFSAARRHMITLELQNALLQVRKRDLDPNGMRFSSMNDEQELLPPIHIKQLQMIQNENDQLRVEKEQMFQRLERTREAIRAVTDVNMNSLPVDRDWTTTLRVMQRDLEHVLERHRKIQANYEDRVRGLQGQLQQAQGDLTQARAEAEKELSPANSAASVQAEVINVQAQIQKVMMRRDELMEGWRKVAEERGIDPQASLEDTNSQTPTAEVAQLRKKSKEQKMELERLQQEMKDQQEREQGSTQQQELRGQLGQLYEELEQMNQMREDERVRSDSEVRELKSDKDAAKDALDDASAQLQHLLAQVDAVKSLRAQAAQQQGNTTPEVSQEDLDKLRFANAERRQHLDLLKEREQSYKHTISELERGQEALVSQTERLTSQAPEPQNGVDPKTYEWDLENRAMELQQMLENSRRACEEEQAEVTRLWESAREAQIHAQALNQSYKQLQQASSDRSPKLP